MSIERKILQKDDILPTEPYVDYIKFININTRCVGSHNFAFATGWVMSLILGLKVLKVKWF